MANWYVVQTKPNDEMKAKMHLLRQGFEVFLPLHKTIRRHARKTEIVNKPLFPRYLFVKMDLDTARWRSINGTRGVVCIVQQDMIPVAVPYGIVEMFKEQADIKGVVPLESLGVFETGKDYEVTTGTFEGYVGSCVKLEGCQEERVALLLDLLGREVEVSIPTYQLKAA